MFATLFAACFIGFVCRAAGEITTTTATLTSTTDSSTVTLTSTTDTSTTTLTTTTMTSTTTLTTTTMTSTTALTDTSTSQQPPTSSTGQSADASTSTEISTSTMVTETSTTGALTPASKVEGSITLSVPDAGAASQLVTDERVAEGWRLAIADVAGVSPEHVQLTVAVRLTATVPLGRRLRKLTSTATIVVSYVIIVPAASEEEATAMSSSVVASISSKSTAGLTETIAQRVSEATGDDNFDMVVQLIEVPTSSTVLQLALPTTTTTTFGGNVERARSSAFSRRALCLGQALLAAVLTASLVW